MRIEIADDVRYLHVIDTGDPELAGRWFAEKAKLLMSADSRYGDCQMRIWPSTPHEQEILSGPVRRSVIESKFTQDSLLVLAQAILDASAKLGELEAARG